MLQADHALLLAKWQPLYSAGQLNTLLNRATGVRRHSGGLAGVVACLTNERGAALVRLVRRDTRVKAHAVQAVVRGKQASVQAPLERWMLMLTA